MPSNDPRLEAFLINSTEIFHSVQHRHEIWKEDPFDVTAVHAEARAIFERLLHFSTTPPGPPSGRILLVLGESGAGKTHLMRAFRHQTHNEGVGFIGYMQMTTATSNYGRYVLSNLIESLDHPYSELQPISGLHRLSKALRGRCGSQLIELLEDEDATYEQDVHQLVRDAADSLIAKENYADLDVDLVRALLYLQWTDPRIKSRVLKYLRCEDLSQADREVIGDMVPRTSDDDPQRMVEQLGKLMSSLGHALVLCVDQLEDMFNHDEATQPFRRAMSTLCALMDRVPSSVIVISCLRDFWTRMKQQLSQSTIDRIEHDPEPVVLTAVRSAEESRAIVSKRLEHLYEIAGAPFEEARPTYPFPDPGFDALSGLRTRDVLDECRRYREKARTLGALPPQFPLGPVSISPIAPEAQPQLDPLWNDFRVGHAVKIPEDETGLQELLAWAISMGNAELSTGHRFQIAPSASGLSVESTPDNARLLVAICNRDPRGGSLGKQIESARKSAKGRTLVVVRSTPFPDNPRSAVATQIGKLVSNGGRRVVLEDSEVRTILAMKDFLQRHQSRPDWKSWILEARPLTRLKAIREILNLDFLHVAVHPTGSPATDSKPVKVPKAPATSSAATTEPLLLGSTEGLFPEPVSIAEEELNRHAAFLGGSGSGKTTVALSLIEQLLVRGIPAILIDRKGDLAGYARSDFSTRPLSQASLAPRRDSLKEKVDVALFTPGRRDGRPLAIPLVPEGVAKLSAIEREQATGHAAQALAGMLDYRFTGKDKSCRAILAQALNLLVQLPMPGELSLEHLIHFIEEPDPSLANAIGRLDGKLLAKLVQDLETLRLSTSTILAPEKEQLDMEALLGLGQDAKPGKTRLSIISTKFLGDNSRILFWVSQFLIEVSRWSSQHPSPKLQAVLLFDEADLYLPAQSQPATKQPMENLLKRARSAGLGIFLATQSPGDLDYKCRDTIRNWFVGRVKEPTALAKMKPMLSEAKGDVASKLPGQGTGEFHLIRDGKVTRLKANPSCLSTDQIAEEELLHLARLAAGTAKSALAG
jgi:GTPase SAR1 family protein